MFIGVLSLGGEGFSGSASNGVSTVYQEFQVSVLDNPLKSCVQKTLIERFMIPSQIFVCASGENQQEVLLSFRDRMSQSFLQLRPTFFV